MLAQVEVYGRFEASERNELWTGDGLHGPQVGGRKAILFAFIDEFSRSLVGYRWGTAENVTRLEAALRAGLSARGVPRAILVDRGSAFVSRQLERACAVLGIRLIHATPRAATTKGKIERFFRTVRDQFLVELGSREVADLDEANWLSARGWRSSIAGVCTRKRSARRSSVSRESRRRSCHHRSFYGRRFCGRTRPCLQEDRDGQPAGNEYEVNAALLGPQVELIFDPFDLEPWRCAMAAAGWAPRCRSASPARCTPK